MRSEPSSPATPPLDRFGATEPGRRACSTCEDPRWSTAVEVIAECHVDVRVSSETRSIERVVVVTDRLAVTGTVRDMAGMLISASRATAACAAVGTAASWPVWRAAVGHIGHGWCVSNEERARWGLDPVIPVPSWACTTPPALGGCAARVAPRLPLSARRDRTPYDTTAAGPYLSLDAVVPVSIYAERDGRLLATRVWNAAVTLTGDGIGVDGQRLLADSEHLSRALAIATEEPWCWWDFD